jgi:hypothetical protein
MQKRISYRLSEKISEAREEELKQMPLLLKVSEDLATRNTTVGEIQRQGLQHIVILGGPASFVKDALLSARLTGENFAGKNILLVPVLYDDSIDKMREQRKGFDTRPLSFDYVFVAEPADNRRWIAFMLREVELAESQGLSGADRRGVVISVRKDGRVQRRGVGMPKWDLVVDELLDENPSKGMFRLIE